MYINVSFQTWGNTHIMWCISRKYDCFCMSVYSFYNSQLQNYSVWQRVVRPKWVKMLEDNECLLFVIWAEGEPKNGSLLSWDKQSCKVRQALPFNTLFTMCLSDWQRILLIWSHFALSVLSFPHLYRLRSIVSTSVLGSLWMDTSCLTFITK